MKRTAAILLVVFAILALAGCAADGAKLSSLPTTSVVTTTSAPAPSVPATGPAALAAAHGLRLLRLVESREVTLPKKIVADAFDASSLAAERASGYDIRPFAGKRVSVLVYEVAAQDSRTSGYLVPGMQLIYEEYDGRCVGAYLNSPGKNLGGGAYALPPTITPSP
jgi:hypothetical protein